MNILHIASYDGNIGDVANHKGFWRLFTKYVTDNYSVIPFEIRQFYQNWNDTTFDLSFVEYMNSFDLVVFGGGRFFDIAVPNSRTGVTIDLPQFLIENLTVPTIFNGIGLRLSVRSTAEMKERFSSFFRSLDKENIIVSLRNDNSTAYLSYLDKELIKDVHIIPDGGFFTAARKYKHIELPENKKVLAINIAKDSLDLRWNNSVEQYERYCIRMSDFIQTFLKEYDWNIVFVPHIPNDLEAINDIIRLLPDKLIRTRITVAPYLNGTVTNGDYIIDLYRQAELVIAMRYHANICSMAMGTPVISIMTLDDNRLLFDNIKEKSSYVDITSDGWQTDLFYVVEETISNSKIISAEYNSMINDLEKMCVPYFNEIKTKLL